MLYYVYNSTGIKYIYYIKYYNGKYMQHMMHYLNYFIQASLQTIHAWKAPTIINIIINLN